MVGCSGNNDASISGTVGLEVGDVGLDDVGGGGVVDGDDRVGLGGVGSDAGDVGLEDVEGAGVVDGGDRVGLGGVDTDAGDVGLDVEGVGDDRVILGGVEPDAPGGDGRGNVSDLLDRSCCGVPLKATFFRSGLSLKITGSTYSGLEANCGLNTVGGVAIII
mgnify:FL=1